MGGKHGRRERLDLQDLTSRFYFVLPCCDVFIQKTTNFTCLIRHCLKLSLIKILEIMAGYTSTLWNAKNSNSEIYIHVVQFTYPMNWFEAVEQFTYHMELNWGCFNICSSGLGEWRVMCGSQWGNSLLYDTCRTKTWPVYPTHINLQSINTVG